MINRVIEFAVGEIGPEEPFLTVKPGLNNIKRQIVLKGVIRNTYHLFPGSPGTVLWLVK